MSAQIAVQPSKPPEKSGSLWNKLKKTMNIKEPDTTTVIQRKSSSNLLTTGHPNGPPRQISQEQLKLIQQGTAVTSKPLNPKNSLRLVQLELANCDHETNILNSKPVPKKSLSQPNTSALPKRASAGNILLNNGHEDMRELRRASTMNVIGNEKLNRLNSDHRLSVPRHSSDACHERATFAISPTYFNKENSPTGKSLWGKVRQQYAPTAVELSEQPPTPKLATFANLWKMVFETVKENNMLDLDDVDPKIWWRKVFLNMKKRHGKAKASDVADQLMQNPQLLSAIQSKLASMVHPSQHLLSLPKSVRRRVKALKKIQYDMVKLESQFYEEVHSLECKYADMYSPLLEKRKHIVLGEVEPTEEECDWPSDEEDAAEDLSDETQQKLSLKPNEDEGEDVKGVEGFWLTALKNVELLASMIQEHDEPILQHLIDIKVQFSEKPMGFSLEFHFAPNEYFTDTVLTKRYEMKSEPDESDPFSFEGPEIVACQGCVINWNKGKNVTVRTIKKKQKHQKHGQVRTVTKQEMQDSFFNFFTPPEAADPEAGEEEDDETEALLHADFEIGHFMRERFIPRAVLFFTGEAIDDDDDDYEDEDDEDDEDDFNEDDDDDAGNPQGKQECKQQ